MAISGLPAAISKGLLDWQTAHSVPRLVIVFIIIAFYLITGCFLDGLACMLLTLPIVYPIITSLGYDGIWWGVIMVREMETAMITPPFGLNLFTVSKACNVPIGTVYRGVWPFIVSDMLHIVMLILVPAISLWLPILIM
jgi:TRAP-type C4-dicarboxylate transport system permease large subunit